MFLLEVWARKAPYHSVCWASADKYTAKAGTPGDAHRERSNQGGAEGKGVLRNARVVEGRGAQFVGVEVSV